MSGALASARRWIDEADIALRDLPEPKCMDADKVATIVSALQIAVSRLADAIEELEGK